MAEPARADSPLTYLPASLPPLGLTRPQAAEFIGIGVTKFDEMVADGRMPKPKRVDSAVRWDRDKLAEAFRALPDEGAAPKRRWNNV